MHIKYWLDSSHLLSEFSQKQGSNAQWESHMGKMLLWELSWDAKIERGRGGGKGEKLLFLFFSVGRETENNAFTQHSY